jgi:heme/copper-type cytochrome/quinol oxidase subunit 4
MAETLEQDRRALYEVAVVLAVALGAIAGALVIATSLPLAAIAVGAVVVWAVGFLVIALVAS